MTQQIDTTIHYYRYDLSNKDDSKAWKTLQKRLLAEKRPFFNVISDPKHSEHPRKTCDESITLETNFLFSNQWNEADSEEKRGRRLFHWYNDYLLLRDQGIAQGHWLEITPEMCDLLETTLVCGYCEALYRKGHYPKRGFCSRCLDSEYLQSEQLFLLRLLPVAKHLPTRKPLTDNERDFLMPKYLEAQTTGTNSRAVAKRKKQRKNVISTAKKAIHHATQERDGYLWLLDHNVNIDNCIYYDHQGIFSFGWRSQRGVSPDVKAALLDVLCEFPFPYEIKCLDGNHVSTLGEK